MAVNQSPECGLSVTAETGHNPHLDTDLKVTESEAESRQVLTEDDVADNRR